MKNLGLFFLFLLLFNQMYAQCWISVSAGAHHSMALKADGTLWTWGNNQYGQIGDGTNNNKYQPTQIGFGEDWKVIAAGEGHSLAIKKDNTLWSWGDNTQGQIGRLYEATYSPNRVKDSIFIVTGMVETNLLCDHVTAGSKHTIAFLSSNFMKGWGYNAFCQLGDSSLVKKIFPTQIGSATNWSSVSGGEYHTLAIKTDGTLWAWGANSLGQLGDSTTVNRYIPKQISSANNWKQIAAGTYHSMAIKADGTLWAWGNNTNGQLGMVSTNSVNIPTQVGSTADWKFIATGQNHCIGIKTNGSLWTWGDNAGGQLGDGSVFIKINPIQIGTDTNWKAAAGGDFHTLAIKTDGSLWAWGHNYHGELGDGTSTDRLYPKQISCPTSILSMPKQSRELNSFSFYPNPANDLLYFRNEKNQMIDKVIITDLLGRKILQQNENSTKIYVLSLVPGMYNIHIYSGEEVYLDKFIKE